MKNLLVTLFACATLSYANAAENKTIRISTDNTDLVLQVGDNGRLYQTYLGEKLLHEQDLNNFQWNIHAGADGSVSKRGWEVYGGSGNEDYFEPAIAITHNDGNPSTMLYYVSSSSKAVEGGTETVVNLRDDQYPVDVTLHYVAYPKENVIKTWSEIKHQAVVYPDVCKQTYFFFGGSQKFRMILHIHHFSGMNGKSNQCRA